ncbi:MAG TPA: FAD/NAD(P)-binding protein [Streptosporangiaceae bacterium]
MQPLADPAARHPWSTPAPWRTAATRRESHDTVTLELEPPPGEVFCFQPGQFNMLYAFGVGEVPISISGDPAADGPVRHTIRNVGMVTHALSTLAPGDQVGVRGPFGTQWPLSAAEGGDVVIVAGGIGLPPLRPAIYHLLGHRDRYRRIVLLYGARTPRDLLFTGELTSWRSRFDLEVEVTVDAAAGDWRGDVGVVPDLIGRATFDPATATAIMVGPEIMMRFTVRSLLAAGLPDDRIFLSMERNMHCAAAMCGHCQLGPFLLCRDGPVLGYRPLAPWLGLREV